MPKEPLSCFHYGDNRDKPDGPPRRSFDLRTRRLFDQPDPEELRAIRQLKDASSSP